MRTRSSAGWVGLLIVAGLVVLALPGLATACPVCSPGDDESRAAFMMTTAFLTALPLTVVGGGLGFLRWRYLQLRRGVKLARRPS